MKSIWNEIGSSTNPCDTSLTGKDRYKHYIQGTNDFPTLLKLFSDN